MNTFAGLLGAAEAKAIAMKSTLKGAKYTMWSLYLFGQQLVLEICLLNC